MNNLFFLRAICESSNVLKIIYFVSKLLEIVLFIVPIGLILMLSFDFLKNVIASKEDEMKKNSSLAIKRVIMVIILFLIPSIVSFMMSLLGDLGVPYMDCINNATLEKIAIFEANEEKEALDKKNQESSNSVILDLGGSKLNVADSGNVTVHTSDNLQLNETIKYLAYQDSYVLKVESTNGSVNDVKWTSSNKKVATVDQNGKVTAVGGGLAIVTATVGNDSVSCKIVAIRNSFKKLNGNPYRTTATIYYDGDKKITYYFRTQGYNTACSSEKVNGKEICTSGFRQWYQGHGCGTTSVTAVVNAYLGNSRDNLISEAKMRMHFEKKEYNWKCSSSDPYCNSKCFQLTRKRVADVLNNQFNLSATAYVIKSKTGNEEHIDRIINALADGRPVIIFVNAKQAETTKFTSQNHVLTMVGFYDDKGNILILDSSHSGIKDEKVTKMVNQYIGRGDGNYRGYIILNNQKK